MEGTGNKRLLNMYILDILREFSDCPDPAGDIEA